MKAEDVCPFDSDSDWFRIYPDACRRCSGGGDVMEGGHRADLEDAHRVMCMRCNGTGKEPEVCPYCGKRHKKEKGN